MILIIVILKKKMKYIIIKKINLKKEEIENYNYIPIKEVKKDAIIILVIFFLFNKTKIILIILQKKYLYSFQYIYYIYLQFALLNKATKNNIIYKFREITSYLKQFDRQYIYAEKNIVDRAHGKIFRIFSITNYKYIYIYIIISLVNILIFVNIVNIIILINLLNNDDYKNFNNTYDNNNKVIYKMEDIIKNIRHFSIDGHSLSAGILRSLCLFTIQKKIFK